MFSIVEAVAQLRNEAGKRQIPNVQNALIYANGGLFSVAAVTILSTLPDIKAKQTLGLVEITILIS